MKSRFSTVRLRYIYIGGASALLSAALLFVVYHMLRFAHNHVLPDTAWITRMMNWGINHIGTKPFFIFIGVAVFAIFFWIRSQKIAEDLSQLARGTADLALGHNQTTPEATTCQPPSDVGSCAICQFCAIGKDDQHR